MEAESRPLVAAQTCFFPDEARHLLVRSGFDHVAVYGDLERGPLTESASEMIWVAKKRR